MDQALDCQTWHSVAYIFNPFPIHLFASRNWNSKVR